MKQHTIIFVPHARAKFRKWRLSSLQASLILGTLIFLTVGGVVSILSYLSVSFDRQRLEQIQSENDALREVNQGFEASIRDLEDEVTEYQSRIHKLAIVAGVAELSPTSEAGIGGPDPLDDDPLTGDLGSLEASLVDMGLGMEALEQRFQRYRRQISATPAVAPVRGLYTSGFGYRKDPFTGQRAYHRGIDIVAPAGTEIVATGDGIVTYAGRSQGLGKAVYISHGFGLVTRYGHMSKIASKVGEQVRRGEVIGYVGSTGRATGTHVHYEVYLDGRPTDPLAYVLDSIAP